MPEHVRKAIDAANLKSRNSQFYHKLSTLNDKIYVFRDVFYTRIPTYQKNFLEKKKQDLELKLKNEKKNFEKEMTQMRSTMKAQDHKMRQKT